MYGESPVRTGALVLQGGVCKVHRAPCFVVTMWRDVRRIAGRKPYYGHIQHRGSQWIASVPGGHQVRSFPRRADAKAWLAQKGIWA